MKHYSLSPKQIEEMFLAGERPVDIAFKLGGLNLAGCAFAGEYETHVNKVLRKALRYAKDDSYLRAYALGAYTRWKGKKK